MEIAGIVLAAGPSTRMGANKLLVELEGEPLVRRTARTAISAGLAPVVVVVGHEAELVLRALAGLPVRPVANARYAEGMNTSLSAGVDAVPASAEALVVLLGDMPLVDAALVREVMQRHAATGAPVVAARYGASTAPPVLYARGLFRELRGGAGDGRGREVVRRHRERAELVDRPPAAMSDVDAPGDLEAIRSTIAGGGVR
jgi:molybdenum cofactor cytidylyltransferase